MTVTLDDILGQLCRWHIPINLFAFIRGFPVTFNIMMFVFAAPKIHHWCSMPDFVSKFHLTTEEWINMTLTPGESSNYQCRRYFVTERDGNLEVDTTRIIKCPLVYDDSEFGGRTLIQEWDLVCDRKWMVSVSQSIFLSGLMFGGVFFSHSSDWFGRKTTTLIGILITMVAAVGTAFCKSFLAYNIVRFIIAIGLSGFSDIAHTMVVETVSPQYRFIAILSIGCGWSFGLLTLPAIAWYLKDWVLMQLYLNSPLILLLLVWMTIPESPRWQLSVGRLDEAKQTLTKVIKYNKFSVPDFDKFIAEAKEKSDQVKEQPKTTVMNLFSKDLAKRTIVFCLEVSASSMVWYYLTVTSVLLGGNAYVNFAIMALTEFPVKALNVFLIRFVKRRMALLGMFSLVTSVLLLSLLVPKECQWIHLVLYMIGKVCTSVNGAVSRVHISESYPTVIRSVAMGTITTAGRLATAIAPFFTDLGEFTYHWIPLALTSTVCLLCAFLIRFLPETYKDSLPDNFTESINIKTSSQTIGEPPVEITHF